MLTSVTGSPNTNDARPSALGSPGAISHLDDAATADMKRFRGGVSASVSPTFVTSSTELAIRRVVQLQNNVGTGWNQLRRILLKVGDLGGTAMARTVNAMNENVNSNRIPTTIDYRMRRDSDSAPSGEACRCGEDRRYPRRPWAYGRRSTIAWSSGRKKRHAARQTRDPLRYECARVVPLPAGDARFGRSSAAGFHAAVPPADRNKTSILRKKFFQAGCSSPTACTLPLPERATVREEASPAGSSRRPCFSSPPTHPCRCRIRDLVCLWHTKRWFLRQHPRVRQFRQWWSPRNLCS